MAEGTGFEPVHASRRDLRLAGECFASQPAFRRMVGEVGFEPTASPRSERGAFASLTTPRWSARSDSNRHYPAPRAGDSASWPTCGNGGRGRIRTFTSATFEVAASASCATRPWRRVRDSNPQPNGYGVAVFGTAGLPVGLTLRTLSVNEKSYDSRDDRKDRLRSDDNAVSRKARVIRGVAILARGDP